MNETNQADPNTNDAAADSIPTLSAADPLEATQPVEIPAAELDAALADVAAFGTGAVNLDTGKHVPLADVQLSAADVAALEAGGIVETHEQAAAINVERTADEGYVAVGDQVPA